MARWNLVIIVLYLLYFLSVLSGRPALERQESGIDREPLGFRIQSMEELEETTPPPAAAPRLVWAPGLVERIVAQRAALVPFQNPLLESDARPDQLERALERGFAADMVKLIALSFWCLLLLLLIPGLLGGHWFYKPMSAGVLSVSAALIFLHSFLEGPGQLLSPEIALYDQLSAFGEYALALAGVAVVLDRLLPPRGSMPLATTPFMGHTRSEGEASASGLRRFGGSLLHSGIIFVAAVLAVNLLLLPLYYLQVLLPGWFAVFLSAACLLLAVFYVRAYLNVGGLPPGRPALLASFSFLGHRFLMNALFLSLLLVVVVFAVIAIVGVVLNNIAALQGFGVLPPPDALQ